MAATKGETLEYLGALQDSIAAERGRTLEAQRREGYPITAAYHEVNRDLACDELERMLRVFVALVTMVGPDEFPDTLHQEEGNPDADGTE